MNVINGRHKPRLAAELNQSNYRWLPIDKVGIDNEAQLNR